MTAPTERVLQDAIVCNPQGFLRETRFSGEIVGDWVYVWPEFPTQCGRADIVFASPGNILVVEVKREAIDENAVAQCLRYMGAILADHQIAIEHLEFSRDRWHVWGAVAAPGFTRNGSLAASAAGLDLVEILPDGGYRRVFESFVGLLPSASYRSALVAALGTASHCAVAEPWQSGSRA